MAIWVVSDSWASCSDRATCPSPGVDWRQELKRSTRTLKVIMSVLALHIYRFMISFMIVIT
jgi:hypothetical protein